MTKEGMGDEAMKKSLFYRAKKMPPSAQIMLLFAVEGVFLQYITSINGFGLNLYATNMGATDSQIGIIQMVPNIVACAALLPLGILADRLKSTKTIPMLTLLVMCAGYAFLGSVPALGERCMELFLVSLAFTAGALAIYNAQWQAMFGAAVSLRQRNDVYAFRNQFMFVIGILAPVICGILMGRCHTADGKLLVLRSFFYLCAVCVLLQAAAIKKIPVEQQEEAAALGAYVEHCFFTTFHGRTPIEEIARQIRAVGCDRVLLTTDFGQLNSPGSDEGMEEYARQLRAQGFSREELETMMCRTPRHLLHPEEQD